MGKTKSNANFWQAGLDNTAGYIVYFDRLLELSACMFKWENLPPEIDPRFIEIALFTDGHVLFTKDGLLETEKQYIVTRAGLSGEFDIYGIPNRRYAYAVNGYINQLDRTNSVIIWNNYLHRADKVAVEMFAKRLYKLDRIIDVNVNAQKTPIMILADEDQKMTMKQVYMQYDGNQPLIFGNKTLDLNTVKALNTGAPYVADKIYQLKTQIWDEALTYLGITNLNVQKKERLLPGEVQYNQGGTFASRHTKLDMRQRACDEINAMFGLNISVQYREDEVEQAMAEAAEKGGYAGGILHDNGGNNSSGTQ